MTEQIREHVENLKMRRKDQDHLPRNNRIEKVGDTAHFVEFENGNFHSFI